MMKHSATTCPERMAAPITRRGMLQGASAGFGWLAFSALFGNAAPVFEVCLGATCTSDALQNMLLLLRVFNERKASRVNMGGVQDGRGCIQRSF